ncbi:MAG: hypothetical protein KKA28_15405 [Planctomycetes bacterium]|nr:hypothetical protein [Planctomycetota bacterium]
MSRSELAHLELLAEVDALVGRLNRWADDAPDWRPAEKCRALVRRLVDRAGSLRVRLEAPLVVATLGGTGAGKSALLNALLGAEVLRTGRSRPTTTRPTLVCRPDITPEMLGIDPAVVELIHRDLPALRNLVLVDCPDPDTTEEESLPSPFGRGAGGEGDNLSPKNVLSPRLPSPAPGNSNLARLRAILPHCDVLLVVATQQKYRSARVADELTAAARGARVVFVQTHADLDADVRDDWRQALGWNGSCTAIPGGDSATVAPTENPGHIFLVDSLSALDDARAGRQPRGEFADLLDLLTRRMAGAAANRIRRANFLDLMADTLDSCRRRIEEALPSVQKTQEAVEERRGLMARRIAARMQTELLTNRRQWENRLLGQAASRWGLSPFSLVLRIYQGLGGLLSGGLLYRTRTPAQMALWGAMEGTRTWRRWRRNRRAERGADRAAADAWDHAELRKAAIIVDGYVAEAGLDRRATRPDAVAAEAETAAAGFVARASADLESLVARLARRHTGWFTRWRYELMLAAMLGLILFRLGKNFFYDSWLATPRAPVSGLDFYLSAGFWLVLWCLLLLWAFCSRLRRGLRGAVASLAVDWQDPSSAAGLFAGVEEECRRVERFHRELEAMRSDVERLRRQVEKGEG